MKLEDIDCNNIFGVYIYIDSSVDINNMSTDGAGLIYYCGLSDSNIKSRIDDHRKDKNFQDYIQKSNIFVCPLANKAETYAIEKLYINAFKPILNTSFKYDTMSISANLLPKLDWYPYEEYIKYINNKSGKKKICATDKKYKFSFGGRHHLSKEELLKNNSLKSIINQLWELFWKIMIYDAIIKNDINKIGYLFDSDRFNYILNDISKNGINANINGIEIKLPIPTEFDKDIKYIKNIEDHLLNHELMWLDDDTRNYFKKCLKEKNNMEI